MDKSGFALTNMYIQSDTFLLIYYRCDTASWGKYLKEYMLQLHAMHVDDNDYDHEINLMR